MPAADLLLLGHMPIDNRFILFGGSDAPLNARDGVIHHIKENIDSNLHEAEPAFLNYATAYLRCLIAVLHDVGGGELVAERTPEWRKQALNIYDAMKNPPEQIATDRRFLMTLFDELHRLCNDSKGRV